MSSPSTIRLPRQWPEHVKSGILHAISLAGVVLSYARGRATGRRRLRAQLEQAETEIALLREELAIKNPRFSPNVVRKLPWKPAGNAVLKSVAYYRTTKK